MNLGHICTEKHVCWSQRGHEVMMPKAKSKVPCFFSLEVMQYLRAEVESFPECYSFQVLCETEERASHLPRFFWL